MNEMKIGDLQIGGKDDGVTLWVCLLVDGNDVIGIGRYTNSISKQSFGVTIQGKAYATGIGPAKQLFALSGKPLQPALGAPNVPILSIKLDGIWGQAGQAEYTVWSDTPVIEQHSGLVRGTWK